MRYRTIITTVLLGMGLLLGAQEHEEGLVLLTDKGHYISGETLKFKAIYRRPAAGSEVEWSRVLYVELVLPNGTPLVQGKVLIDSSGAAGSMIIPEGLSSGTYYLKAYTRWMQRCGPEGYLYASIGIYDPYNVQALPVDSLGWPPKQAGELLNQTGEHAPQMLECLLEKEAYGTRMEVVADLKWKYPHAAADLSVSVTRSGLHGSQEYYQPGCPLDLPGNSVILPENLGLSLTGQAVNAADGKPAPYATIYISVLGGERDFFCNYSDSLGRFYFAFPDYVGKRELFVSTYHAEYNELELLIDRDFSQDLLQLPSRPVILNDSLTAAITEMSVNAQVSQQYYQTVELVPEIPEDDGRLFYGTPMSTSNFEDYINLPTLEEYFVEVIPQVSVRRSRGVRRLVMLGEHHDLAIYPPLLMIDGVAIFDAEAVLEVSPRLIERVEIVNAPYIRGNVTFGGIISLISKNNDLGYIDLPSSGLLVNYQMLDIPLSDNTQTGVTDPRLPDVRNTLYWNPGIVLNPDQSKRISFRTSDLTGSYEILIRGYDSTGKFLEERVTFSVE